MASIKMFLKGLSKVPKNLVISFFFMTIALLLLKEEEKNINKRILGAQTESKKTRTEIFAWEQILLERPNYKDGWVRLANAYLKIGETEQAKEALLKAKNLDPLDETVKLLEKIIENWK